MGQFAGLTVFISGATGGFGTRSAEKLAQGGANLVLTDIDKNRLQDLAERLPCESALISGDVTDERLFKKAVKLAIDKFGALDIAINNAGIAQSFVKLHQVPSAEARSIMDVDVMGVFYAMKHQINQMDKQYRNEGRGGIIVNIASIAGLGGAPKLSVYAAAKHAVIGLTKSAAAEYATKGIRVNAVCPSFARTEMALQFLRTAPEGEEAATANLVRGVPMKRLAEVDEVVEAILFAANPDNSFMTGQTLAVDGGIEAI
ncbi:MAG: SDR family NAD(P)-dependent oxidoreductase [Rhizobiaceae bacterium]